MFFLWYTKNVKKPNMEELLWKKQNVRLGFVRPTAVSRFMRNGHPLRWRLEEWISFVNAVNQHCIWNRMLCSSIICR